MLYRSMATPKYKQYFDLMVEKNQALVQEFREVHDAFANNGSRADDFHRIGRDFLDAVRDWERRLCSGMERGRYASYSAKLAEKYWELVNKNFPMADQVGVKSR